MKHWILVLALLCGRVAAEDSDICFENDVACVTFRSTGETVSVPSFRWQDVDEASHIRRIKEAVANAEKRRKIAVPSYVPSVAVVCTTYG